MKDKKLKIFAMAIIVSVLLIFLLIWIISPNQEVENSDVSAESEFETFDESKIISGGPPKGGIGFDRGIPALDQGNVSFVSVSEADEWIEDNELALAIIYKNTKRVYPFQIMVWHEIINEEIEGDPLLITYCPLCGSGIAYERQIEINGEKIETKFGTSGKLYNSNLIMYDEETDTYWTQIDGVAIVGELTGQELKEISIDTVVWRDWKKEHPDSEVLSQDTGFRRDYGRDPYGNYYEDSFLIFPVDNRDSSGVHAKTVVFGIEIDGEFKAYREDDLIEKEKIVDNFNGVNLEITRSSGGVVKIINTDTNEEIVKERGFWFSWYAFHPTTELYNSS